MAFYAHLVSRSFAYNYEDGRVKSLGIGAGSTDTVFNIDGSTLTWVDTGDDFVFISGLNVNYGSTVVSTVTSGGYITQVTVADPMPYVPSVGDQFIVVHRNSGLGFSDLGVLGRVVDGSVEFRAMGGPIRAELEIHPFSGHGFKVSEDVVGDAIRISDGSGRDVWFGVIDEISISDRRVSVVAVGLIEMLKTYRYDVDWSATATTRDVLMDILVSSPTHLSLGYGGFVDRKVFDSGTNTFIYELANAQTSSGGIGPFNFSETVPVAYDAVMRVLEVGAMPLAPEALYLQIWGQRLYLTRRAGDDYTVDYYISAKDADVDLEADSVVRGLSGKYNKLSITYTQDGVVLYTTPVYDLLSYARDGIREYVESLDEAGQARIIAEWRSKLKTKTIFSGRVRLGHRVWLGGLLGSSVPPWWVRPLDRLHVQESRYGRDIVMDVGSVTVSFPNGDVQVTPLEYTDPIEIVSQYIDMDT